MAERLRGQFAGVLILLFASLSQFHLLSLDLRFLPDEAHFMTFARGAAVQGRWMLPGALDKPPLSIYASAISMAFVGNRVDADGVLHLDIRAGEFAGKLPNAMLAVVSVALMTRLGGQVSRRRAGGLLSGSLFACSPFTLIYGPSAFTDMSLLVCLLAAVSCGLSRRWAWAGALMGLAFWCKPQAIFALPVVLALPLRASESRQSWLRMAVPMAVVCGALLLWDAARPETSIFALGAVNNLGGQLLANAADWTARLTAWIESGAWLLGPPLATGIVVFLTVFGLRYAQDRRLIAWLLAGIGVYLAAHTGLRINVYARYLLLILPAAAILMSLAVAHHRRLRVLVVVCAVIGAIWTVQQGNPLEDDRANHAGIDELARYLNDTPVATVIYDPWLGWQLDYYLGAWHDKRRVHYPNPESLAAGAAALDEVGDRFFVAPHDKPTDAWLAAIGAAGFDIQREYQDAQYRVWRLTPPSASP